MNWERVRFSALKVGDVFHREEFLFTVVKQTEKRKAVVCDRLAPLCDLPWADDEEALAKADIIERVVPPQTLTHVYLKWGVCFDLG